MVIPKAQHQLRLAKLDSGTLRRIAREIRTTAKTILHLPFGTPTAFFHLHSKEGGLQLPDVESMVSISRLARFDALRSSSDPLINQLASTSNRIDKEITLWQRRLDTNLLSRSQLKKEQKRKDTARTSEYRQTTTGSLFKDAGKSTTKNKWIKDGGGLSGNDYIIATKAISEQLPTRINTHRGQQGDPLPCRRCGAPAETQLHALQECPGIRNATATRHNWICNKLTSVLQDSGATVFQEPTINHQGYNYKPDLVVIRGRRLTIVDVAVAYDNTQQRLLDRQKQKIEKYDPILSTALELWNATAGEVLALVIGTRGLTLRATVDNTLRSLGVYSKTLSDQLSLGTLRGTCMIWRKFLDRRALM